MEQKIKDSECIDVGAATSIGGEAHETTFRVMLGFGAVLGLYVGLQEISHADSSGALDVLKEAMAFTIFFLLSLVGLYGYFFAEVLKFRKSRSHVINRARAFSRACLSVGTGCGYVASGTLIGLGITSLVIFAVAGNCELINDARMLFVIGLFLHCLSWIFMYLGLLMEGFEDWTSTALAIGLSILTIVFTAQNDPRFMTILTFALAAAFVVATIMHFRNLSNVARAKGAQQHAAGDV